MARKNGKKSGGKLASGKKAKVFVGMSGGVDSSVSAALLKKAGYDVTGVFIKVWQPDWIECTSREDRRDAMRAAAHLSIPLVTLDLEDEYKRGVIDRMIAEYASGRTPNPDVLCNREVKFGAFWKWAKEHGADYIATGHYARIAFDRDNKNRKYTLKKGADNEKDQTYFLWTLTQDDLSHTLFPVGHLKKSKVRELARKFKLPNALKKDSQGLCFIGHVNIKDFLARYVKGNKAANPGDVLDVSGRKIGTHPGSLFFTMGERHGFILSEKTPNDEPMYVVAKDISKNTITVAPRRKVHEIASARMKQVDIDCVSWVKGVPPSTSFSSVKLGGRTRYRQPLRRVEIKTGSGQSQNKCTVVFEKPDDVLAPGQSLVIYDMKSGECLGGGIMLE